MSKYVFIYPHPDDESYNGSLLIQKLVGEGHDVSLVTLTKGGLGENHTDSKDLKAQRVEEIKKATELLNIHKYKILDYQDGSLKTTSANWAKALTKILSCKTDYVVTYDPTGTTGHPDHIVVSEFIYNHWRIIKNYKLLWYLPSFWQWQFYIKNKSQTKYKPSFVITGTFTTKLKKLAAIYQHGSQFNKSLANRLKHYLFILTGQESYHLVNNQDRPKFVYNTSN